MDVGFEAIIRIDFIEKISIFYPLIFASILSRKNYYFL